MDRRTLKATSAAVLGNAIFGFSFMFSRIALSVTDPTVLLAYRFGITFAILLLIALLARRAGRGRRGNEEIAWLRFELRGRSILPLLALGAVQPVAYFFCESYGIRLTNATVSGVIISVIPIVGIAAGALLLKEYPSRRQILFSVLSILAVAWLTLLQSEGGSVQPLGVLLLFGAVLAATAFNVLSRRLSSGYSVLERTVVMMGVAAAVFILQAVLSHWDDPGALVDPIRRPEFLSAVGYLSICSSVVAFMAMNYVNNYLPIAKTTAFANLTTVISLFAGVVFLHEPFSVRTLLASAIIVICIRQVQKG